MKSVRTIAMYTDHSYYGTPIECSRVTLYVDECVTPEEIEFLKEQQVSRLRSMAKRMPHMYWYENERTGYEEAR